MPYPIEEGQNCPACGGGVLYRDEESGLLDCPCCGLDEDPSSDAPALILYEDAISDQIAPTSYIAQDKS